VGSGGSCRRAEFGAGAFGFQVTQTRVVAKAMCTGGLFGQNPAVPDAFTDDRRRVFGVASSAPVTENRSAAPRPLGRVKAFQALSAAWHLFAASPPASCITGGVDARARRPRHATAIPGVIRQGRQAACPQRVAGFYEGRFRQSSSRPSTASSADEVALGPTVNQFKPRPGP